MYSMHAVVRKEYNNIQFFGGYVCFEYFHHETWPQKTDFIYYLVFGFFQLF